MTLADALEPILDVCPPVVVVATILSRCEHLHVRVKDEELLVVGRLKSTRRRDQENAGSGTLVDLPGEG